MKQTATPSLNDLLNKQEPLCDELKMYLTDIGGFYALRHPLIYAVPYFASQNALLNYQLQVRKETAKKYKKEGVLEKYIFLHERPYRLAAFDEVKSRLQNPEYWMLLHDIWIDSENIWQNKKIWKRLLTAKKGLRHCFMVKDDRVALFDMPQIITVYRGCSELNKDGYSWTLSEDKASMFAVRYKSFKKSGQAAGMIISKQIDKKKIFAYTNQRNEQEIIIL